jgi:pseudouridine synthase
VLIRLQKILSTAGVSSRRSSEAIIAEGRVTVNGRPVTELGSKADPETDDIRVDGRRVRTTMPRRYILMYKPRGYITSRSDPEGRPTVIDLLATGGVRDYVYPVGRLDYESEGLLILTTDGDLAERLMHPSHGVDREYHVRVRGVPDHRALERLARGIVLDGRKTAPAEVAIVKVMEGSGGEEALVSIAVHEGRNRQIRRMCEAVGHPVIRLRRVRIGPIHDGHIRPGEFRDLDEREVAALKRKASRPPSKAPRPKGSGTSHAARSTKHVAPRTPHIERRTPHVERRQSNVAEPPTLPTPRREGLPRTGPGPRPRGPRPSGRPRRG